MERLKDFLKMVPLAGKRFCEFVALFKGPMKDNIRRALWLHVGKMQMEFRKVCIKANNLIVFNRHVQSLYVLIHKNKCKIIGTYFQIYL
ncbi:MAG TPA: hypothetical protein VD907_06780 [Verrucomicrobiae bacterium]|nr:hypothetical protein [Verrucomicrobiae bacterium]